MIDLLPIMEFKSCQQRSIVIAGPCSAESEEQIIETAVKLSLAGIKIFRAGIWKPRTKPGCFEGVGKRGLEWLKRVKIETGMSTSTEVATPRHAEEALKWGVDLLWIGARTSANPFIVQEIAEALRGTDVPVMVKNPVNPDLDLWIGALERLNKAGVKRLAAIHRGFSTYGESVYRNTPQWQIPIELRRLIPDLPILCDPSHIGGRRDLILPLSQIALDLKFNGLIIESHYKPSEALSDASQQITPEQLKTILNQLVERRDPNLKEDIGLRKFRERIDYCDQRIIEILTERFIIAREIGHYKKERNLAIFQSDRYSEIIDRLASEGSHLNIDPRCVKSVFESIHTESVRQQLGIIDKQQK